MSKSLFKSLYKGALNMRAPRNPENANDRMFSAVNLFCALKDYNQTSL